MKTCPNCNDAEMMINKSGTDYLCPNCFFLENMNVPVSLSEMVNFISKYKYKTYSFPMFMLVFDQSNKMWSAGFRNVIDSDLPNTDSKTAEEACSKLIKFIERK